MEKNRIDDYIKEITEADLVGDLNDVPRRGDYDTVPEWMTALEAYRNRVITPPTEDKPIIVPPGFSGTS